MTIACAPSSARTSKALVGKAVAGTIVRTLAWPFVTLGRAIEARRQIAQMAQLSDYMLKDIGLQRQDLQDAASLSPFTDPTRLLVSRVVERRAARFLSRERKKN
ncbi:DUF1127 domain-containing protein [Blastochloris tepida]|uniref:YjiS-like domain-containing protein n=1 Tax=Blastochloris tepida TaxID=2233851 RepID=A0A348G2P1_9HYPH|nr:DUF1127 domain-containing protein [Blastochloris tepida]BBF93824.1 hypothetical protein BLTE_25090 [Blastochloris tepida]